MPDSGHLNDLFAILNVLKVLFFPTFYLHRHLLRKLLR